MAKGGFTGAVPPRETSPEKYSGVWDITEQYGEQKAGSWPFQADDCAPKSLRFDSYSPSGYLTRTPAAASNQRTWTWSGWVKRSIADGDWRALFTAQNPDNSNRNDGIWFSGSSPEPDQIYISFGDSTNIQFSPKHRDSSAWFHICVSVDTTRAADQVECFVNGEKLSIDSGSQPSQNYQGGINSAVSHSISRRDTSNAQFFDGYLSEIHFIDGQALSCEEFGFFDGQGIWQPKRFTGDYSSGEFYTNTLSGVDGSAVTNPQNAFDGSLTTSSNTTGGTKFTPKGGSQSNVTSLRFYSKSFGQGGTIKLNGTTIESNYDFGQGGWYAFSSTALSNISNTLTSFEWDRQPGSGSNNYDYIYAIEINGTILTDATVGRNSFHLDFSDGVKDQSGVGNDWTGNNVSIFSGSAESRIWETSDTGWTIASGGGSAVKTESNYHDLFTGLLEPGKIYAFTTAWPNGDDNGGWWFGDSNSLSLSGTHPNQGRGTNSLGQRGRSASPANDTAGAYGTFLAPNSLSTASDSNLSGFQNINPYGTTSIDWVVDRTTNKVWAKPSSNSTWVKGGNPSDASSTPTFHLPATGNLYFGFNQNSTMSSPGATITSFSFTPTDRADDIFVDSPVNGNEASTGAGGERRGNYATLNPLDRQSTNGVLSNGNLDIKQTAASWAMYRSTIFVSSGKYYWEVTLGNNQYSTIGICSSAYQMGSATNNWANASSEMFGFYPYNGDVYNGSNTISYASGDTSASGSVIGVALDMDNGTLVFYKDGTSLGQATSGLVGKSWSPTHWLYSQTNADSYNFGQRSFSQTPPAGYSPLATSFLPEPTIKRGDEAMDVAVYTGNGTTTNTISGLSISPDLVWLKRRNSAGHHALYDTVRGAYKHIGTSHTNSEYTESAGRGLSAFNSDGFTINTSNGEHVGNGNINVDDGTYVAWVWDAGDSTTTIAAGGLNSSAYASGRTWSSDLSATSLANQGKMFDWTYGYGSYTGTCIWTTTNAAYSSLSGRVYLANNTTVTLGITFKDSGNNVLGSFNLLWTGDGTQMQDTGFDWSSNVAKVEITGDYLPVRVQIGNQTLVDTGTTVPNVPSIASTVRANPTAGFSICTYTSPNSSSSQSFAHSLNAKPDFVLVKNRDNAYNWDIYHSSLGYNSSLIFTNATTRSGAFSAEPTSHVVNTQNLYTHNGSDKYLALCWTAVEGYSAFGSYEGTGSASNSPFVFLGFKPALVILKLTGGANSSWKIYDDKRDVDNPIEKQLYPNDIVGEPSDNARCDFLSNGFKVRTGGSEDNYDNNTIIYAAFASSPFASNNRAR